MSLPPSLSWAKRHLYEAGLDLPYEDPSSPDAALRAKLQRTLDQANARQADRERKRRHAT